MHDGRADFLALLLHVRSSRANVTTPEGCGRSVGTSQTASHGHQAFPQELTLVRARTHVDAGTCREEFLERREGPFRLAATSRSTWTLVRPLTQPALHFLTHKDTSDCSQGLQCLQQTCWAYCTPKPRLPQLQLANTDRLHTSSWRLLLWRSLVSVHLD